MAAEPFGSLGESQVGGTHQRVSGNGIHFSVYLVNHVDDLFLQLLLGGGPEIVEILGADLALGEDVDGRVPFAVTHAAPICPGGEGSVVRGVGEGDLRRPVLTKGDGGFLAVEEIVVQVYSVQVDGLLPGRGLVRYLEGDGHLGEEVVEHQGNVRIVVVQGGTADRIGIREVVLGGGSAQGFGRQGERIVADAEARAEESHGGVAVAVVQPAEEKVVAADPLIGGVRAVIPFGIRGVPFQGVVDVVAVAIVPVADLENVRIAHRVGGLCLEGGGETNPGRHLGKVLLPVAGRRERERQDGRKEYRIVLSHHLLFYSTPISMSGWTIHCSWRG